MNNTVYGQTLLDITKFSDFELVKVDIIGFKGNITGYEMKLYTYSQCKKCRN